MKEMSGVRAVVTGASGFIGTHLAEQLAARGATVVGFDREPAPSPAIAAHHRVELTDTGTRELLTAELAAADVVYHLAGRDGVRETGAAAGTARRRDNGLATVTVVGLTPVHTPLFVASASSVYGGACVHGGRPVPSHEDDPLHPRGGHARSKVLAERMCEPRRARGGLVTVVRPFTVAGPGQRDDMAVSRWLQAARTGEPAVVLGALERRRDVVDVRQVARALVELAAHPDVPVVNLGTGRPVQLGAVLSAVVGALGTPLDVHVEPASAEEPAVTCADTDRLARRLGWVPETDLDELVGAQLAAVSAARSATRSGGAADLHSQAVSANIT